MNEGMTEQAAEVLSQRYNIVAMAIFCVSRFVCTFLLKYIKPSKLLTYLGIAGAALVLGVIFLDGRAGMYCLVAVSACMSLMFPTIYGIALTDTGEDAKFGCSRTHHGHLGRLGAASPSGSYHRRQRRRKHRLSEFELHFAINLLCRHRFLRLIRHQN